MGQVRLAVGGQFYTARQAQEQVSIQAGLQVTDALADRGLCQTELVGRRGEVPEPARRFEDPEPG